MYLLLAPAGPRHSGSPRPVPGLSCPTPLGLARPGVPPCGAFLKRYLPVERVPRGPAARLDGEVALVE